jgi:cytochrome c oxidase subunit 3
LFLCIGLLFAIPFPFSLYFVYASPLAAVISLGIGVPVLVISIAGWVKETVSTHTHEHEHMHLGEVTGLGLDAMEYFIVAEALIFVAFFVSYWVTRLSATSWPPAGTPHISMAAPMVMTLILVTSSITMHVAELQLKKNRLQGMIGWLVVTMILGTVFVGFSINEWAHLFGEGFNFTTNIYSSSFFSITGFHMSHVLVGLGMFIAILLPALGGKTNKTFIKSAGVYWHFVDIVWFFVLSQVYFW